MDDLAISMTSVSKTYSDFVLDKVNLSLPTGEVLGFIGQNGAGKSTTIRILMGLVGHDSGEVRVLNHRLPEQQIEAKLQIGFTSEDLRLYQSVNLRWHMNFLSSIYPSWDPVYAYHLARKFGLNVDRKITGFSHGQRVKASLLLCLAHRPKLLILDEPTTGLDPIARSDLLVEMKDALAEEERTILFSSHNIQDVESLSDRIAFIDRGRILRNSRKNIYIDSWRRVLVKSVKELVFPKSTISSEIKLDGAYMTMLTNSVDKLLPSLAAQGAVVEKIERLTLEEIFVAEVSANRRTSCA